MPPKGGNPSLSEDELKAALTEMLKQSGLAP
jgi:cytochrome c5